MVLTLNSSVFHPFRRKKRKRWGHGSLQQKKKCIERKQRRLPVGVTDSMESIDRRVRLYWFRFLLLLWAGK